MYHRVNLAFKLLHEEKGVRDVYSKAEYREQRHSMLQNLVELEKWTSLCRRFGSALRPGNEA